MERDNRGMRARGRKGDWGGSNTGIEYRTVVGETARNGVGALTQIL